MSLSWSCLRKLLRSLWMPYMSSCSAPNELDALNKQLTPVDLQSIVKSPAGNQLFMALYDLSIPDYFSTHNKVTTLSLLKDACQRWRLGRSPWAQKLTTSYGISTSRFSSPHLPPSPACKQLLLVGLKMLRWHLLLTRPSSSAQMIGWSKTMKAPRTNFWLF